MTYNMSLPFQFQSFVYFIIWGGGPFGYPKGSISVSVDPNTSSLTHRESFKSIVGEIRGLGSVRNGQYIFSFFKIKAVTRDTRSCAGTFVPMWASLRSWGEGIFTLIYHLLQTEKASSK